MIVVLFDIDSQLAWVWNESTASERESFEKNQDGKDISMESIISFAFQLGRSRLSTNERNQQMIAPIWSGLKMFIG